jgi:hypothetical protein
VVTVTVVETVNDRTFATIRVGDTLFVVEAGAAFGSGFVLQSIEGSCVRLSYQGASVALICTDGTVLK